MASLEYKQRRSLKCLLYGVFICVLTLVVSLIFLEKSKSNYRSLMYTDDETPEDMYDYNKILHGDTDEIERVKIETITKSFKNITQITDEQYIVQTKDCENFLRSHKYLPFPLSEEEKAFPVAYSILVHHKVQNFERLLRSIYSPQNLYCIHVDKKSPESTIRAIAGIVSCIDNVFFASKLEQVVYASWSRVQADINCMNDLYKADNQWKYFINLCGQDFPIKTNLEIVRALKALTGANSLETVITPPHKHSRWKKKFEVINGRIQQTTQDNNPPPLGIKLFSGSAYIVVSRDFVRYVLEDPKVQVLISWLNETYSPDEFIWATIQRMPGVPGFLPPHSKYDLTDMNSIARLVKWGGHEVELDAPYPPCQGIHIRDVCVYGVGDLKWLLEQHHLFANKFDADFDPVVIRCLEKYLRQKAIKMYY